MKIIIAGGGKVGSVLCSELATEDNDIIIIEKNEIRLEQLINKIDISGIVGNGASIDIQKEAGVENSDIFIAVTPQDEVNIMACILAQKLGAKYTIARVRNPEYSKHFDSFRESLGVNLMINPEMESARSIAKIIKFPDILSIQSFAKDQVELIELEVQKDSPLANMSLNDFRTRYGEILVCTIRRKGETIIPSGQNTIRIGEHIYVLGSKATIRKFYKKTSRKTKDVQSVLIIGGGRLTYYLLDVLKDYHMAIKVIEQHREIAEDLSASYPNVEIILGDGTDQDILIQEGIENYNAFVSLTGVDEENIIASLYALQQSVDKVVTKVNREILLGIFDSLGMESVITPKRVIANSILRFVRSLGNPSISDVEALYRLANNEAEAIQFKVKNGSKAVGIPLEKLATRDNLLVAYIIRNRKLIIPTGQDSIQPSDQVIIITKDKYFDDIDDILR